MINSKCCSTCRHWTRLQGDDSYSGTCSAAIPVAVSITGLFSKLARFDRKEMPGGQGTDCGAYLKKIIRKKKSTESGTITG